MWVDNVAFSFVMHSVINDEFYSVREDGSYRLDGLVRCVLIQSVNDYFAETIEQKGISRSRQNQIFIYARELAQKFKKYE